MMQRMEIRAEDVKVDIEILDELFAKAEIDAFGVSFDDLAQNKN